MLSSPSARAREAGGARPAWSAPPGWPAGERLAAATAGSAGGPSWPGAGMRKIFVIGCPIPGRNPAFSSESNFRGEGDRSCP